MKNNICFNLHLMLIGYFSLFHLSAHCQLQVCNQTTSLVYVAVGYNVNGQWQAWGWYHIAAGQCLNVLEGDLTRQNYYLHAKDNLDGNWTGSYSFCTTNTAFNGLLDEDNCTSHKKKSFFQIKTEGQKHCRVDLKKTSGGVTSHTTRFIHKPENCMVVSELTNLTIPLLQKFLNIATPNELYRQHNIDIGYDARLQFAVHRNGTIRAKELYSGRDYGAIEISFPVRVVDARVDWREDLWLGSISHHEDIEGTEITIQSVINFKIEGNSINTEINNGFSWNNKPYFTIFGIDISISGLCEPHIHDALLGMNQNWRNSMSPLLQNFINGDCEWKNVAQKAVGYLNRFNVGESDANELQRLVKTYIDSELD